MYKNAKTIVQKKNRKNFNKSDRIPQHIFCIFNYTECAKKSPWEARSSFKIIIDPIDVLGLPVQTASKNLELGMANTLVNKNYFY